MWAPSEQIGALEALLFASAEPLSLQRLSALMELDSEQARSLLDALADRCQSPDRGIQLAETAEGFQLVTKAVWKELVGRLFPPNEWRLSHAALEVLAVIAYRQPVTRADIEAIRGVSSERVLQTLMQKELIKESGRADTLGNPRLYMTTDKFLQVFNLSALSDLPPLTLPAKEEDYERA